MYFILSAFIKPIRLNIVILIVVYEPQIMLTALILAIFYTECSIKPIRLNAVMLNASIKTNVTSDIILSAIYAECLS